MKYALNIIEKVLNTCEYNARFVHNGMHLICNIKSSRFKNSTEVRIACAGCSYFSPCLAERVRGVVYMAKSNFSKATRKFANILTAIAINVQATNISWPTKTPFAKRPTTREDCLDKA